MRRFRISIEDSSRSTSPAPRPGFRPTRTSQPAASRILSDVVPAAIAALPDTLRGHLRIAQQARPEDLERVAARYATAGIPAEVAPFFDDVPRRFSEAQLVISRAGASTLADLTVIGRPSILVPLAAAIRDLEAPLRERLERDGLLELFEQVELPLTRADIADYLGLTIETVSRQFTRLRTQGVIDIVNKREISVPDIDALAERADQDVSPLV